MTITVGLTYRDKDIDALRDHEKDSTSAAVNEIAARAGATQTHTIRGDDKTEREIHDETKAVGRGLKELGIEVGHHGIAHVAEHFLGEGAIGGFGAAAMATALGGGAVVVTLAGMHAVGEDDIAGHERAEAYSKDAMHAFMVGNLAGLPREYADAELSRFPESAKSGAFAKSLDARLGKGDTALLARCQLHCDQGMAAAREMIDSKRNAPSADIADRCAKDPAFKAGFDAVVWASAKNPQAYKEVIAGLESRDARYEQSHVQWRAM